ncbi:GNAT family N-acetyltransferase [Rhodopseudomonas palustris]|uniref:GNAT family N-acetyltransferase n=1 Tax=Rhodopseudomonas palustris TaxID=1076 RepID=UPI002ACDB4DF|nr:GNAT family N-acetyltransferase [Rhodopseudomonas palustris]WQG99241.1 GNAT family N-acetyltransferase [Rhodopseudomonas palustris]
MTTAFTLRPYRDADEDAAIGLWLRTWRLAYPAIDFDKRVDWWRARWRGELVPHAAIVIAENSGGMIGFVTIDGAGYLDQLVVEPEHWGWGVAEALVDEAKRLSPREVTLKVNADNYRAIKFYRRHGFAVTGEETNSSGRPVLNMRWGP